MTTLESRPIRSMAEFRMTYHHAPHSRKEMREMPSEVGREIALASLNAVASAIAGNPGNDASLDPRGPTREFTAALAAMAGRDTE